MSIIDEIEDLWQEYTVFMRYNNESEPNCWVMRYLYIHKSWQLLDMRIDKNYEIFMKIIPQEIIKKITYEVATSSWYEELWSWRENLYKLYIY